MSTKEDIKAIEQENQTASQAAQRLAKEARMAKRKARLESKENEEVKDPKELQKEIKKLQRELKREQRATKSADQFEKEIKAQKEELDAIIDTHMPYILTDKNLIITNSSRAFSDLFGYGIQESIGQSYKILIQHEDAEKFYNGCEYVSSHGKEAWGTDIKMLSINNDTIHTHTFIYPMFVAGALDGFTFVIEDISS
ncbi:MAG: PAS domain-containing protein, partial [Campylobacterota bacterium]|nr:PAS domain-containing protein [Campylobacterota bacterium]